MLQKSERLKERYLFDLAFKLGKIKKQKLSCPYFQLYYLLKKSIHQKTFPKCGFVISLKVDKRAVIRNLYKRRMREAYLFAKKKLNISSNTKLFALVFVINPEIKDASFLQIKDTMYKMLEKIVINNQ